MAECQAGVPIFVGYWGGIICNFSIILPYFQHCGMNLDHDFVQVSNLSEDQKKGLHQKWNTFFPNSSEHIRSDAHYSQTIGGKCRCRPYLNNWGGYSQIIWEIYPLPPLGFLHPWCEAPALR